MATKLILGPSHDGWDEPASAPPLPLGNVGVVFGTPAITPGGIVNLVTSPVDPATTPVYPLLAHAVYVPKGQETALVAGKEAAAFLASSFPQGVTPVTAGPSAAIVISVPGVTPGLYFVQTVLEYPV